MRLVIDGLNRLAMRAVLAGFLRVWIFLAKLSNRIKLARNTDRSVNVIY